MTSEAQVTEAHRSEMRRAVSLLADRLLGVTLVMSAEREFADGILTLVNSWQAQALADAERRGMERAAGLLRRLEFAGNYRKCPICLGWEVVKGHGECAGVHTKDCELAAAIRSTP